jgi:hypothetical protein
MVNAFDDTDTLGGQVTRLSKSRNIDASAGSDRGEKNLEWARGAGYGRLISSNSEVPKVSVYSGTAGEIDYHFHTILLYTKR